MTNTEIASKIRDLYEVASGGTWVPDERGLFITTDDCPLCTPRKRKLAKGEMGNMVTSTPRYDEEEKELILIRGWGHLQKHGEEAGERVQKTNADLICFLHNHALEIAKLLEA